MKTMTNKTWIARGWIAGAAIAVLLGLNLVQGSALLGLYARSHVAARASTPVALNTGQVRQLPPAGRAAVTPVVETSAPVLRARLREVRHARRELVSYISSPDYDRAEAERRFEALRAKDQAAQKVAQTMLLDAADTLTPEDRAQVVATFREVD